MAICKFLGVQPRSQRVTRVTYLAEFMAVQIKVSSSPSEKIFNALSSNVAIKVSIRAIISMSSQSLGAELLDPAHTASASCDSNLPLFHTYSDRNLPRQLAILAHIQRSQLAMATSRQPSWDHMHTPNVILHVLNTPCVDGRILVAFLYVASRRNYLRHFIAASRTQFWDFSKIFDTGL